VPRSDIVVGLDIGTTKICVVIGRPLDDETVDILGVGVHPSLGLKKGVVVDLEETVRSIDAAVQKAEQMAGVEVERAVVGLTGEHISAMNVAGRVTVSDGRDVTEETVERVKQSAQDNVVVPREREIIDFLPRDYTVDGQSGIRHPVGMTGMHLEVSAHVVTGMTSVINNVIKCVERNHIEVEDRVLESIATAEAVLTPAEKELGVLLVDIGGGTTDIAVFLDGSVCHTSSIPVAGNHVTRDIAIGLRAGIDEAEKAKVSYGCAIPEDVSESEQIGIVAAGLEELQHVPRRLLAEIIEPRLEEIFVMVKNDVRRSGTYDLIASGIVLSGGGSQLSGTTELASRILDDLPARVGLPRNVSGLKENVRSPIYATGVGLVLLGMRRRSEAALEAQPPPVPGFVAQLVEWLRAVNPFAGAE